MLLLTGDIYGLGKNKQHTAMLPLAPKGMGYLFPREVECSLSGEHKNRVQRPELKKDDGIARRQHGNCKGESRLL